MDNMKGLNRIKQSIDNV